MSLIEAAIERATQKKAERMRKLHKNPSFKAANKARIQTYWKLKREKSGRKKEKGKFYNKWKEDRKKIYKSFF